MTIDVQKQLLNRSISCGCGQQHFVPIETVIVDDDVMKDIVAFLCEKQFHRLLLVSDANTNEVFAEEIRKQLVSAGFFAVTCVFSQTHDLLPDKFAIEAVRHALDGLPFADVILAIGSGVITDIVRYVSFERDLPFISVATAPSMDGYASGMAAMQFHGIKVTTAARPPIAIFAKLSILTGAPFALIQSGFGDLVGKVTSLSDWILATTLYGEHFCKKAYGLVYEPLEYVLNHAVELHHRDPEAVRNLFVGLVNAGIAMAMVGNSRPCSGSEHHCSHYWDLLVFKGLREHTPHGLQVGYATSWVARMYTYFTEQHHNDVLDLRVDMKVTNGFMDYAKRFYGYGAKEVITSQQDKSRWLADNNHFRSHATVAILVDALKPIRPLISQCDVALQEMEIPTTVGFLQIDSQRLRNTLIHANELRARFTILDLLAQQGWLESVIHALLN